MTFVHRQRIDELMDDPGLAPDLHQQALAGLANINAVSRTAARVWEPIRTLLCAKRQQSFTLLDVASGGGDLLHALARRAAVSGFRCRLVGWDISPQANAHARESNVAPAGVELDFVTHNALTDTHSEPFDFVASTLFLHHLGESESQQVLTRMRGLARQAVVVDDLIRSRLGYVLAWAGCRLLSRSPIVHFDGPASVKQAYTVGEIKALADRAGMHGARIDRHWPCRFRLVWQPPHG